MNYQELKDQISAMEGRSAHDYREMLSLSAVAGDVWPKYRKHLESATTPDEFFEAIYQDDTLKFENLWAYWAKMRHSRDWLDRFECDSMRRDVLLDNRGVFLSGKDGNELLIPMKGRGKKYNVYVFDENGFNEKAAELYGSTYGSFTCCDVELEGAFDIYRADRALIFERWAIDKLIRRKDGKGQIRTGCDCAAVW